MTIKSETAYKLESYRSLFYAPIVLGVLCQLVLNLSYRSYFGDLIIWNLVASGSALVACGAYFFFRNQSRFVTFYATMGMEEWRHKTYELYLLRRLWEKVQTYPYVPVLIALILALVHYGLLSKGLFPPIEHSDANNDFGLLWQIHASILGLVFVTLSFLIGLLSADELNKKIDAGKRLANKVHFKSITVFNTLLTVWVGYTALIPTATPWMESATIFAFLFLICSIIYLFQSFMKYLFELDLLRGLVLAELKANLRSALGAEIKSKVSEQFFQKVGKERQIFVGYDSADNFSRPVAGEKKGLVVDVDLISLEKLARHIKTTIPVKNSTEGTTDSYKAVLLKGLTFHSPITERRETIGLVAKGEAESTNALFQGVFKIKDFERRDEFAENLKELTDSVIGYLKASPNKSVETMEFMGALIDESLEVMREYQIEFSYETSQHLTHFDWRSIGLLVYALDDIFKEIYRSGNVEMATRTLSFIDDRINSAIRQHNHYLFKEFLGSYVRLYYLTVRSDNMSERARKDIAQNIHRKIQDLFKHGLKLDHDATNDPNETKFYMGVARDTQRIVRELNKVALDGKDIEGLKAFSKTLKTVSSTLERYQDVRTLRNEIEIIRMDVESNGSTTEKEDKIRHLTDLVELNETLEKNDTMSRFALGAWAVEQYRRQEIDEKFFAQALSLFQEGFNSLKSISDVFFEIKKDYRHHGLNLTSWEMEGHADGEVHSIRMDWLTYFYVLTVLKRVPDQITADQFVYGEGLKEYSSSYLEVILKEVEQDLKDIDANKAFWKPVLPDKMRNVAGVEVAFDDLEKKENLLELHRRGVKQREKEESEYLATTPIDDGVWKKFQEEFMKEYEEAKSLKRIIKESGTYSDLTNQPDEDETGFGIKTLDFKYHFIKDWYISTHGIPEHFASAMVRGETTKISEAILEAISATDPIASDEDLLTRIDSMISILQEAGHEPNVILIGNWIKIHNLRRSRDFVPNNEDTRSDFQGSYKGINVYYVQGEELHNKAIVLDLKKVGSFTQKQVKGEPGKEVYTGVRTITKEDIDQWIEKDAEIVKRDGVLMPRDEIEAYMGERVLLDILQKFDFTVLDTTAGLYSEITDT